MKNSRSLKQFNIFDKKRSWKCARGNFDFLATEELMQWSYPFSLGNTQKIWAEEMDPKFKLFIVKPQAIEHLSPPPSLNFDGLKLIAFLFVT